MSYQPALQRSPPSHLPNVSPSIFSLSAMLAPLNFFRKTTKVSCAPPEKNPKVPGNLEHSTGELFTMSWASPMLTPSSFFLLPNQPIQLSQLLPRLPNLCASGAFNRGAISWRLSAAPFPFSLIDQFKKIFAAKLFVILVTF